MDRSKIYSDDSAELGNWLVDKEYTMKTFDRIQIDQTPSKKHPETSLNKQQPGKKKKKKKKKNLPRIKNKKQ